MKRIKFIPIILLGIIAILSCEKEESLISQIESSTNLAGFELPSMAVTRIADGSEYTIQVRMKLAGPTTRDLSDDITVTLGADTSSTAVAGTHYRFDNTSITLSKSNNYLGLFEFTMLTDGIVTPLETSPVLVLRATDATGESTVINSGRPINITLNYACPSDLEGSYTATVLRDGVELAASPYTDYITMTGVGTYRTTEVGHWIGGLGVGVPGYTFTDVCGVIDVPQQSLVEYYSNVVQSTEPGSVDPVTGVIHIVYSISSSGWTSVYDCTYVPD